MSVTWLSACPYINSEIGKPVNFCERNVTGTRYAVMRMMYCATCVQVMDFMPPSSEHSRTPERPTNTPM